MQSLETKKRKVSEQGSDNKLVPKFEIELRDMSNLKTYFFFNPNKQTLENRAKKNDYSRKEISLVMSRTALTKQMVEEMLVLERLIFYFLYPKFSKFCLLFSIFFTIQFDAKYFLSYILLIMIVLYVSQNSKF